MRIVWQSNSPTNNSGYGKQTALFVPRIRDLGHEVAAISAPYSFGGAPIEWNGIPVLGTARDSAGNDTIIPNHEYANADLTILLADPFSLLKSAELLAQIPLAMWFPVDCSPLGKGDVTVLRESGAIPVAMSGFGFRMLEDEGAEPMYVPHGIDTQLYSPGDPAPYRDTVPGVTDDTFIIGIVAMNRDLHRKGFQEQLLAFSRFHSEYPDSMLAIHSTPVSNPGLDLHAMAAQLGISSAIAFPDGYSYDLSLVSEEQMVSFYRGLDVLSLCSYGEGFGLPLVEAQACGIPVISTDASAMSELCGAGWLVSGTAYWTVGHQSWWIRPDAEDIYHAYVAAWKAREKGTLPRQQARDFALQFDADHVFATFWEPVLHKLEEYIK